jgi:nucleotide-binding universal stress UspA family protein
MFQTIIVAIDGRAQDDDALALARRLADPGARFIAANVSEPGDGVFQAGTIELAAELLANGQAVVAEFVQRHPWCEGIATSAPTVGTGLQRIADGEQADLVVAASSRRARPGRVFAGATVWSVLRHSSCPVAVATAHRGGAHDFKQIVVGFDGSDEAKLAIELGGQIATRERATLSAVEVVDPVIPVTAVAGASVPADLAGDRARARADLARVADEYGVAGYVSFGQAAHELAERSDEADLLVVGFKDHDLLERLLTGSTSRALLRHQAVPLLFVPSTAVPATAL